MFKGILRCGKITIREYPIKCVHLSKLRRFHVLNVSQQVDVSNTVLFQTPGPHTIKQKTEEVKQIQNDVESNEESVDINAGGDEDNIECQPKLNPSDVIALRAYQKECIKTIVDTLSTQKTHKIAISIATGGGKTVIFSMAIPEILKLSRFKNDTANGILILVHRRELATQTIKTLQKLKIFDDDRIFLDMGKNKIDPNRTFNDSRPFVVVGSVPTLARADCSRLMNYDIERFKAVIVDECHHSVSDSYIALFEKLKCSKQNKDENGPFLLGFTATMGRADKVPLKKVFDKIVFQKHIAALIEENHLCDFDWLRVELGLNLQDVEIQGSDFQTNSLAKHINTPEINKIALMTYFKFKDKYPQNTKSVLIFCVNVAHMQSVSEIFRANGINAQYVSGETKSSERDNIVNDFKNGKIPVLINCGVFTEGTDIPNIDTIFLLRPTKSKPLLIQMVGRGLRLSDEKEKLLVVDFVDNKSIGLSLDSTLNGKSDAIKLLCFGGVDNNGFGNRNRDELLPGDVKYIKFNNYKGIEMLYNEEKKSKSMPYQLLKNMKNLNYLDNTPVWTQVKYNAWAMSTGHKAYFKVETTNANEYLAYHCFSKSGFKNKTQLISNKIIENSDFEVVINAIRDFIEKHEFIKDEMYLIHKREKYMRSSPITETQRKFIKGIIEPTVEATRSDALDVKKFTELFNSKVNGMSRLNAYQIIFAYTIGRKQSIMLWLKENFLNSDKSRKLITNDSILTENKNLVDDGWV